MHAFKVNHTDQPILSRISRRRLLQLGLNSVVGAGTLVGVVTSSSGCKKSIPNTKKGFRRIRLSNKLRQNIAFGLIDAGEELILWLNSTDSVKPLAYSLNPPAQLIWYLCDSLRTKNEIATEYSSITHRKETEAIDFLAELTKHNLVVSGGYMVVSEGLNQNMPRRQGSWRRVDMPNSNGIIQHE